MAEQAHEWLLKLETASPEECEEFWQWLLESPIHVREVLAAEAADVLMRKWFVAKRFDADALVKNAKAANVHLIHDQTDEAMDKARSATVTPIRANVDAPTAQTRKPSWRRFAMAASFLAVVAVGAIAYQLLSPQKIRTGPGEWQTVTLSDGSEVTAGPRTQVIVEYTNEKRTLRVITGEAMFHVAHNQQRPFFVETELATARAVGTAFAVSRESGEQTIVTVEEGVVAVTKSHQNGGSVTLRAGDEISVTKNGALSTRRVNPQVRLAWTHGIVILQDQTVEEAVHEFNKRSSKQIQVLDRNLAQSMVGDVRFDAASPDRFAQWLEDQGQARIKPSSDSNTLLLVPFAQGVDKGPGQQER